MIPDAVVTDSDVRTAQDVLDAWLEEPAHPGRKANLSPVALLQLRGLLAARFADVRAAGHLEGVQQGRREVAQLLHETLRDEGLAP